MNIKDKIVKTEKGYFFDTDTECYVKLSDEICDLIDAPASDFQEEGERWQTVEDLLEEQLNKIPHLLTPDSGSKPLDEVREKAVRAFADWCVKHDNRAMDYADCRNRAETYLSEGGHNE